MPETDYLKVALSGLDCNSLIADFISKDAELGAVRDSCAHLALWTNTLSKSEPNNLASPFLYEMQRASHDAALLIASALYVPAAACMRSALETALYYTYFRTHPAELTTLAKNSDYYISKQDILNFHKEHTPTYRDFCGEFGFPGILNDWYRNISGIVHGQLPGKWGSRLSLKDTKHDLTVLPLVIESFKASVEIIHYFLLLTVGVEVWGSVDHRSKAIFLKGMTAERRQLLKLDGKK